MRTLFVVCGLLLAQFLGAAPPAHKLLVLSVDGLDWRYLRDRDAMGLKIPNMRRLLKQGQSADGVVGVWPTITWPSHTSLITGVRPDEHGIQGNRRPKSEGGDYYWTVDLLKAPTLWQVAHQHGLTTASVTWPVTGNAPIDFDLPEWFARRNGGFMDLRTVAAKGTPGLAEAIGKEYPSFGQQWMDDRTRILAARYLLRVKGPDLLLVHLVDLDSEEHDEGPYGANAMAMLERTDELLGDLLKDLPSSYRLALVSDHGFERVDKIANPRVLAVQQKVNGEVRPLGGIVVANDPSGAEFLRKAASDPSNCIGREIPHDELVRYAPKLQGATAAFEPADHVMFGPADGGPYFTGPSEKGNHGFWPTRHDYRSIFLLWGPGVKTGTMPTIPMTDIAGLLGKQLGLPKLP